MKNRFVDDNLQLIDLSKEDDYLVAFHSLEDVKVSDNGERRRQSLLRKSLGWDSAFFANAGLLNHEELFMINTGFKNSNPTTQKDAKRSTKIGCSNSFKKVNNCSQYNKEKVAGLPKICSSRFSNSNAANDVKIENKIRKAQDSKRSLSGGLPKLTYFTSPTIQKPVNPSCESSSKNLSKSIKRKVNPQNMKSVNSPSSVLHFLSSSSASSIDTEPLSSATVTHQNTISALDLQSLDSKERKFISLSAKTRTTTLSGGQKRKIKPSSLCMPSPKTELFDEKLGSTQDESKIVQCQSYNLSSCGVCLKVGKYLSREHDQRKIGSRCSKSKPDSGKRSGTLCITVQTKNGLFLFLLVVNYISVNREELFVTNKGFKKSNSTTTKNAKISKVTTKLGGQSNALSCKKLNNASAVKGSAQDFKRSTLGGLLKSTCFTTPITEKLHHSYESSSEKLLNRKVKPENIKFVNSPSSILHFPLSCSSMSPASSIDGDSLDFHNQDSKERKLVSQNAPIKSSCLRMQSPRIKFFDKELGGMKDCFGGQNNEDLQLSETFDNVNEDIQSKPRRQSLLCKSLAWDSAFFTSAGLLNPEELFLVNKGFKKSNLTTPRDAKTSKATTKIGARQSNGLSCKKINNAAAVQRSVKMENKTRTALDSHTSPTTEKSVHLSHASSSKNFSKSVKREVNHENTKSVNSPYSILRFPMLPSSTSPANSIDGQYLSSTPVTRQNTIPAGFQSQDPVERKFISQNGVKASGLRMPSPKIGFFDMGIA